MKLVEEEGRKEERQRNSQTSSKENQPGRPVVVINPRLLNAAGQREYYNIVSGRQRPTSRKRPNSLKIRPLSRGHQLREFYLSSTWVIRSSPLTTLGPYA